VRRGKRGRRDGVEDGSSRHLLGEGEPPSEVSDEESGEDEEGV
jgi:hypothetical protein